MTSHWLLIFNSIWYSILSCASNWVIVLNMLHDRICKEACIISNKELKMPTTNHLVVNQTGFDFISNPISVYRVYDGVVFASIKSNWNVQFVYFCQVNLRWWCLSIKSHVHRDTIIILLEFLWFNDLQKVVHTFNGWASRIMSEISFNFFDIQVSEIVGCCKSYSNLAILCPNATINSNRIMPQIIVHHIIVSKEFSNRLHILLIFHLELINRSDLWYAGYSSKGNK